MLVFDGGINFTAAPKNCKLIVMVMAVMVAILNDIV